MVLKHCPSEYYDNCLNAAKLCLRCAAGYGRAQAKLHYAPREANLLPPHPYEAKRFQNRKTRGAIVKRARVEEERARQSLIKATVNSGALYGDGDYKITDWLHCDHKHRQKLCKQFTLTLQEYEKGLSQGVESWVVTIHPTEGETLRGVFLTERAFARLLQEAKYTNINQEGTDV